MWHEIMIAIAGVLVTTALIMVAIVGLSYTRWGTWISYSAVETLVAVSTIMNGAGALVLIVDILTLSVTLLSE